MTRVSVHANAALALKGEFASEGRPSSDNRDNVTVRSVGDGGNSAAYLAARLKKVGRDDLLQHDPSELLPLCLR